MAGTRPRANDTIQPAVVLELFACGTSMPLDPIETLQRLVQIPSVNPLGHTASDATHGERRLTEYLQQLCRQQGWRWLRQRVHPDRDNLVALVPGQPAAADGGELLLWDVHQDTVAIEGMTVDPFGGQRRDGCVFGRGACDVKGPMAAMLAALSRLDRHRPQPGRPANRPSVAIAFTVNEECGFTGASALGQLWNPTLQAQAKIVDGTITPAELFPRPPDAAIVAEPTGLDVVVAHQGVVRWRVHLHGRAAHSSQPQQGVNAIYAMAGVVQAVAAYQQRLAQAAVPHPRCGRPSVCVSTIHGGVGINTVPDRATIEIDRRLSPGDDPQATYEELIRHIADSTDPGDARIEHERPFMQSTGLADRHNRPWAERIVRLVREAGLDGRAIGVPYGTDAAAIGSAGVPTVVFGPGSISQAHTVDEFIAVESLRQGADLYERIAAGVVPASAPPGASAQ